MTYPKQYVNRRNVVKLSDMTKHTKPYNPFIALEKAQPNLDGAAYIQSRLLVPVYVRIQGEEQRESVLWGIETCITKHEVEQNDGDGLSNLILSRRADNNIAIRAAMIDSWIKEGVTGIKTDADARYPILAIELTNSFAYSKEYRNGSINEDVEALQQAYQEYLELEEEDG